MPLRSLRRPRLARDEHRSKTGRVNGSAACARRAENTGQTATGRVYAKSVDEKRLYLHLGDRVYSDSHEEWGVGAVVEEMTSTIVGGTCLVRVLFEDGHQRTFNNDLDHEMCCYFLGVRREMSWDWDRMRRTSHSGRRRVASR